MNFSYLLLIILVEKVVSFPSLVKCNLDSSKALSTKNIKTSQGTIMGGATTESATAFQQSSQTVIGGGTVVFTFGTQATKGIIHATGGSFSCAASGGTDAGCSTGTMCRYDTLPAGGTVTWTAPMTGNYAVFFAAASGQTSAFERQTLTVLVGNSGNTPTASPVTASPVSAGSSSAPTAPLKCSVGGVGYDANGKALDINVPFTEVQAISPYDTCKEIFITYSGITSCMRSLSQSTECIPFTVTAPINLTATGPEVTATTEITCCSTNLCNTKCVPGVSSSVVRLMPYYAAIVVVVFRLLA